MSHSQTSFSVACIQMEPRIGDVGYNNARLVGMIEKAAASGARLVVLPELANTGYVFESRDEAYALSQEVPEGDTCKALASVAHGTQVYIVSGILERSHGRLYNSAVLIGPDGHIGTYRKNHLWADENIYFEPGNLGYPVFHLPIGRIGIAICYDGWFPETYRLLALQGADIICVPTNWVPIPGQRDGQEAMANILAKASAHVNGVYIACADRVGTERGQPFEGQSLIVGPAGWPLAGPADRWTEEIIAAEVDVAQARRGRKWNSFNHVIRDRRTDQYAELLGADISRARH